MLQSYYNDKLSGSQDRKPLSRRTVEYIRTIIGSSLQQAYKNDLIVKNVNDATVLPKKEQFEIEPLTVSELNEVIEAAKGTKMYALIVTEIYTGMRRGEILGLRWADVDFNNNCIHVRKSLCRVQNNEPDSKRKIDYILMTPKTKKSVRDIPMSGELIKVLKQHRLQQKEIKMKYRTAYQDSDVVFARDSGEFEDPREVLRRFHKILEKAGVRKCRFHDLRHTFASVLLNSGEEMKNIQELLGHSTITTTMDVYSHLSDASKKKSIEVLEKAMVMGE